MNPFSRWPLSLCLPVLLAGMFPSSSPGTSNRAFTFEDRVRAQEAVDRVYYSHQSGTTQTFEAAVPRATLENKVRRYLKESTALERIWKRPVTADDLHQELERIAANTRFPDRLREIYDALGNDPLMIEECFARPSLVDRLARRLFAADRRIHGSSLTKAESLRQRLVSGELPLGAEDSAWTIHETVRLDAASRAARYRRGPAPESSPLHRSPDEIPLDAEAFDDWRERLNLRAGEISPIIEEEGAFAIRAVLSESADRVELVQYVVPRTTWDRWWPSAAQGLDETSMAQVAVAGSRGLPMPRAVTALACVPREFWIPMSTFGAPAPRTAHTAVWTGTEMIVWGGIAGSMALDTGGRYDPLLDVWTPTRSLNAPPGRFYHTAVWTGSVMIVWGGRDFSTSLDSGSMYSPQFDVWTPTSEANVPWKRDNHTSVWTGQFMIVWDGDDKGIYGGATHNGGRFDPVNNSWSAISTTAAPEPRTLHEAIWTGRRMLIWGGAENIPSAGKYDPARDVWEPMSLVNAPSDRIDATAVWTGTEMIVWGGDTGTIPDSALNTGGRYDPDLDSWQQTSLTGAPGGRFGFASVWTGHDMIVWGGRYWDGQAYQRYGDGARYDPVTDTWSPTPLIGAPTPRSGIAGAWTGNSMIVWSGFLTQLLDDGALYFSPQALGNDLDGDGVDDACDNCVGVYNPGQADEDLDRVADACDNCASAYNPTQHDVDHNGVGDACDVERCDGIDNNDNGQVDEGNPGGGALCDTGQLGVCREGTVTCVSAALTCVRNVEPSPEVCDGLNNNCDGLVDEHNPGGGATCSTALPGICAAGTTVCQNGGLNCAPDHAPRTETCNGLDDDCNGVVDDVTGPACTLFATVPVVGDPLDCTSPKVTQPTISWTAAQYDRFKVFINTSPDFVAAKGITSGSHLLKTSSWHVPKAAWVSLCKKARNGEAVYVKIRGIDVDVPAKDPLKRFFSPVVAATARK